MMKRLLSAFLFLTALLLAQPVQAQGVKVGVKGGFNNTEMSFSKDVFDSSNRFGWFAGPTVKVSLLGGLGFDVAALYDQKEAKVNDNTIKQTSILVPVNARLNVGLGNAAGIYLAAGPQLGFNIGTDEFRWDKENVENTFQLKKASFGVNLGAGVYLSQHFEVGFTYQVAVGNTADASFKKGLDAISDDTKSKSWTLSAAYYF